MPGNHGFFGFPFKTDEFRYINIARPTYGTSGATISNWSGNFTDVIDANDGTYWAGASNPVADDWIKLYLRNPYGIDKIRFFQYPYNGAWGATQFRIQISNDNSTWVTIKTIYPASDDLWIYLDALTYSKYWRFYAVTGGANSWNIYTIELWGYYYD
jgi:hypothetical protein